MRRIDLKHFCTAILAFSVFALAFSGCGDSGIVIPVRINSSLAFSASKILVDYAKQYQVNFPNPYPNSSLFPPTRILLPLTLSRVINLEKKKSLVDNKDSLQEVFIDGIQFSVSKNTLSCPIKEITISFAKLDENGNPPVDDASYTIAGKIPVIEVGELSTLFLNAVPEAETGLVDLIKDIKFALRISAVVEFDSQHEVNGVVGALPSGVLEASLTLDVAAVASLSAAL